MKVYCKRSFPVSNVRHYLEPGPIVLVSSMYRGRTNVMTLGWQTVMEFTPSLVGCIIAESNHSFEMIRKSRQCVINLPTADLAKEVVGIGNCSGATVDKFAKFKLTATPSEHVSAPGIAECVASFECKLSDASMVRKYNFFIFEVVAAHAAPVPKFPRTLHFHGKGIFSTPAPKRLNLLRRFTKYRN